MCDAGAEGLRSEAEQPRCSSCPRRPPAVQSHPAKQGTGDIISGPQAGPTPAHGAARQLNGVTLI